MCSNIGKLTAKKTPLIKSNTTGALIFFPLLYSKPGIIKKGTLSLDDSHIYFLEKMPPTMWRRSGQL